VSPDRYKSRKLCGVLTLIIVLATSCSPTSNVGAGLVSRSSVEAAHGLKLPPSARNCQQRRVGGLLDHGVLSLFELDENEVQNFVAQLKIKSRNSPAKAGAGDPSLNGWNVWPENAATFVPGNRDLGRLKRTWTSDAKPIEMLSCSSPKGDWLHVEIWSVGEHALVKLYTDWN